MALIFEVLFKIQYSDLSYVCLGLFKNATAFTKIIYKLLEASSIFSFPYITVINFRSLISTCAISQPQHRVYI